MNKSRSSSNVVIVGAGMAGLAAARELHRRDIQAVVLEARDRVGGRVHCHDYGSGTIDLGATWFWPNEPLVQSLLMEYGLRAFPQPNTGDALYVRRGGDVQRLPSTLFASESYRFAGGAQSLPLAMAAELPPGSVRLNTPAERILVEHDRVIVETGTGTISAHNAIIAVPPPLALEIIDLIPPLPESFAQIARRTMVWMASMVKAVAIYPWPFWREQGLSGTALSETGPFREFHDHSPANGDLAALFGFAPAEAVAGDDQSAIEDVFIQQLARCFGSEAARPRGVFVANWQAERYTSPRHQNAPLTTATYGHPFFREGQQVARILWASTETADAFAGHLEGAIRAGLHAADAVDRASG